MPLMPIERTVCATLQSSAIELCHGILDLDRWPEFDGYGIIPGIASATFERRTATVVGSTIRVRNRDGSSHVEEITAWEPGSLAEFTFQDFSRPLNVLAKCFVEKWTFDESACGTHVARTMVLYPRNALGLLVLWPISVLMTTALRRHLVRLDGSQSVFHG